MSEAVGTRASVASAAKTVRRSGRSIVTLASLAISLLLLAAVYRSIDIRLVAATLLRADLVVVLVAVWGIVPITYLRAVRFAWVVPPGALPGTAEAFRLTLVSSALNVFLPAKTGDLVKSYFVATRGAVAPGVALSIVVYERLCDLGALIAWCLVGWAISRPDVPGLSPLFWAALATVGAVCLALASSERAATALVSLAGWCWPDGRARKLRSLLDGWPALLRTLRGRRAGIIGFSLLLWLTHLVQIWGFTLAFPVAVPFAAGASLSALALMAGQVPFTIAGLGARDAALVVLLARYMPTETAAALGVLMTTRNVLPPLLGLPVMGRYVASTLDDARRWRQGMSGGA